jgi:hypothetical protein
MPQQKLLTKERVGTRVIKKHDTAKTPHQRTILRTELRQRPVITMNAAFKRIMALSRQINALTAQLETLALAKKAPRRLPVPADGTNEPVSHTS